MAIARDLHLRPFRLEQAGQREHIADVILHHENPPTLERDVLSARYFQHTLPIGRQRGFDLMQEQRHLIEQTLRRARILENDRLRETAQFLLIIRAQCAAGVDDDGRNRDILLFRHALEQFEAAEVRQGQIHDHAIECHAAQGLERLARRSPPR